MKKEYILKCVANDNSLLGYFQLVKNGFFSEYGLGCKEQATKFKNFDAALYEKNMAYRNGFSLRLVIEEVEAKSEEVKIPGYTLHGDYYLADDIITNVTWKEACRMRKPVALPNGEIVIAHILSKEELETISKEERKISENGHTWYWTNTPSDDYNAWFVDSNGDFYIYSYIFGSFGDGGARLGFKNPFLKETPSEDEINSAVNEVMDLFDYERVHKVMEFLDWKWAGKDIPEIYDLRFESRRLLEEAANKVIEGEEYYFVATGGFKAEAWKNDEGKLELRLNFTLEESENWS